MKAPHNEWDTSDSLSDDSSSSSSLRVNWTMTWAAKVLQTRRKADKENTLTKNKNTQEKKESKFDFTVLYLYLTRKINYV